MSKLIRQMPIKEIGHALHKQQPFFPLKGVPLSGIGVVLDLLACPVQRPVDGRRPLGWRRRIIHPDVDLHRRSHQIEVIDGRKLVQKLGAGQDEL